MCLLPFLLPLYRLRPLVYSSGYHIIIQLRYNSLHLTRQSRIRPEEVYRLKRWPHSRCQGSFVLFNNVTAVRKMLGNFFRSAIIKLKKQEKSLEIEVGGTAYHKVGKSLLQIFRFIKCTSIPYLIQKCPTLDSRELLFFTEAGAAIFLGLNNIFVGYIFRHLQSKFCYFCPSFLCPVVGP